MIDSWSCCNSNFFSKKKNFECFIKYNFFSIKASTAYTGGIMDVDKELFLWSVITGRRDFAMLFWSRGKNKICK